MSSRRVCEVVALLGIATIAGLSLGLYYNYTYFGAAAWPMPHPIALAAPLCYYLALPAHCEAVQQAWLWMLSFPLAAALLWPATAALLRQQGVPPRRILLAFAVGLGPLCLPVPWLAWLHAGGAEASWQRFLDACLYRHFTAPPAGLASLYLALAMGGTAGELAVLLHGQENRARIAGSWLAGALLGIVATSLVAGPLGMALSR